MARLVIPIHLPVSFALAMAFSITHGAKLPIAGPSSVATGEVDVFLLAGGSLHGPSLGLKTRFKNGFELGFHHAQWQGGYAQDAGIYFMAPSDPVPGRRLFMGTEFFRSNGDRFALGGMAAKPALLFVLGREHRLGGRLALSYEGSGGFRLTRSYTGALPPMVMQGRVQFLCRVM